MNRREMMILSAASAASLASGARALTNSADISLFPPDSASPARNGLGMDPMFVKVFPEQGELVFLLRDDIQSPIYSWPRTLLTYPVDFSHRPCAAEQLHLTDEAGKAVPIQLSENQKTQDGLLIFAKVSFFSTLEPGATHKFTLEIGNPAAQPQGLSVKVIQDGKTRIVDSGLLRVRLPESQTIAEGEEVPGPLLAIDRGQGWIGASRVQTGRLHLRGIETTVVDTGTLFDIYRVAYAFDGGARYEATLKSVLGYPFVDFSESMSGLDSGMGVSVEMDWTGFAPERRYAANGWAQPNGYLGIDEPVSTPGIIEEPHWWPADRVEDPQKEMIFRLAAFQGNAPRDAVPAMSFWETGDHGQELSVFVPDTKDWDDKQYMIWQPTTLLQVSFRSTGGRLIWNWPLVSGRRRTGISLIFMQAGEEAMRQMRDTYAAEGKGYPRAFVDNGAFAPGTLHGRYAQWLRSWYGSLDLNRVKDWILDYPSNLRQAPSPLSRNLRAPATSPSLRRRISTSANSSTPC